MRDFFFWQKANLPERMECQVGIPDTTLGISTQAFGVEQRKTG